ncbi:RWD-domain-containing protein [Serendipita vermifera]|nr:RWD-domain-containing protein [Serendipita vermifera]
MTEVLAEEFEVLESIYPDELTKVSDTEISIVVEPEEPVSGLHDFKISLQVSYPPEYPDVYPEVALESFNEGGNLGAQGVLTEEEEKRLLSSLETVGNENIGTAMTFTLVSHLREQLSEILKERAEKIKQEEQEKERKALEEEEARTKGTPVTTESFLKWRASFNAEQAEKKRKEDQEKMKGWTPKEREEAKRVDQRLTGESDIWMVFHFCSWLDLFCLGRQLFERGGPQALNLEDASLFEEGTESVDITKYDRTEREEEQENTGGVHLSDSD